MQINDKTLTDVMVGDVWMVSGQSNIDTNIERVYPQYAADIDAYSNGNIRLFRVNTDYSAGSASPSRGNFFHFPPCGGTEFLL